MFATSFLTCSGIPTRNNVYQTRYIWRMSVPRLYDTLESSVSEGASRVTTTTNRLAVVSIKTVHTLIFLFMSASILYILYAGLTRTYDALLVAAFAALILEIVVYLANGLRCPLTKLAQNYGDPTGNDLIADLFLPPAFARRIPPVCGGLFALSVIVLIANYLISLS
jgi:hypothetical protein